MNNLTKAPQPLPAPQLLSHHTDWSALREEAITIIRPWLEQERNTINAKFLEDQHITTAIRNHSNAMDRMLRWLAEAAHIMLRAPLPFSLIAIGGYGRRELFPYSDIDILLLCHTQPPPEPTAEDREAATIHPTQHAIEFILYCLWDCGLQIGHSVRTHEDTLTHAHQDHTIFTALQDARYIAGKRKAVNSLQQALGDLLSPPETQNFIENKLNERNERHKKWGDSRYILEPNIKEGKGAQRDLQTLAWIAKPAYHIATIKDLVKLGKLTEREYRSYKKSRRFLWVVRMHLHLQTKRPEEQLTFDHQRIVAEAMGYRGSTLNESVERFMKRYFQVARDVGALTRLFCTTLEEEQKSPSRFFLASVLEHNRRLQYFTISGRRIQFKNDSIPERNPITIIKLFHHACQHKLDIHPKALQLVSRNLKRIDKTLQHDPEANQMFLDILLNPTHGTEFLRKLNDANVLGRFIPDFRWITGQMQFDMYHVYTVDEHTIMAISLLHSIERGACAQELPLATTLMPLITERRVLYIAMLCHDIAKGRGGDHEINGTPIAKKIAKRMGLNRNDIELVGWLVANQSLFITHAFKRDVNDPATIRHLAKEMVSLKRLRLLLLMSVADVKAVGPKVWNGWKGGLMRDLYGHTERFLQTGSTQAPMEPVEVLAPKILKQLPAMPEKITISEYLAQGDTHYITSHSATEHAQIISLMERMYKDPDHIGIHFASDSFLDTTELTIATRDKKGLMSDIAGAVTLAHLNIMSAKIFTLKDGTAIQNWQLQDLQHQAVDSEFSQQTLSDIIHRILTGDRDLKSALTTRAHQDMRRKQDSFHHAPEISFENHLSPACTIIETSGMDRVGLLHDICHALQSARININSAHINTYGEQAVNVFYVKDPYGMKIRHPERLDALENALHYAVLGKNAS